MPRKFLSVFPNPYSFIDADGNPAGAFPCDATHTGGALQFVGARIEPVVLEEPETMTVQRRAGGQSVSATIVVRPGREKTRFVFDEKEPELVPDTAYYRQALSRGEILPANDEAARAGGIRGFRGVDELRDRARATAAAHFIAERGVAPSWVEAHKAPSPSAETRAEASARPAEPTTQSDEASLPNEVLPRADIPAQPDEGETTATSN